MTDSSLGLEAAHVRVIDKICYINRLEVLDISVRVTATSFDVDLLIRSDKPPWLGNIITILVGNPKGVSQNVTAFSPNASASQLGNAIVYAVERTSTDIYRLTCGSLWEFFKRKPLKNLAWKYAAYSNDIKVHLLGGQATRDEKLPLHLDAYLSSKISLWGMKTTENIWERISNWANTHKSTCTTSMDFFTGVLRLELSDPINPQYQLNRTFTSDKPIKVKKQIPQSPTHWWIERNKDYGQPSMLHRGELNSEPWDHMAFWDGTDYNTGFARYETALEASTTEKINREDQRNNVTIDPSDIVVATAELYDEHLIGVQMFKSLTLCDEKYVYGGELTSIQYSGIERLKITAEIQVKKIYYKETGEVVPWMQLE